MIAARHLLEFILAQTFVTICRAMPQTWAHLLGRSIGWIAWMVSSGPRKRAEENVKRLLPDKNTKAVVRSCYNHFGVAIADAVRVGVKTPRIEWKGLDNLQRAYDLGRGVMLVTGHLGNWEVAAAGLAGLGLPLSLMVAPMSNRRVDFLATSIRNSAGVDIVNRNSLRSVVRRFDRGRIVGTAADQWPTGRSTTIDWFGQPTRAALGPAWFVHRTKAPMVGLFAPKTKDGYRVELITIWDGIEPLPDMKSLTGRWMGILEGYIRKYPSQWLWMHRRWRENSGEKGAAERKIREVVPT